MTGFDWFVAALFSFFALCCLVGAWGFLTGYRGWISRLYAFVYAFLAIGLFYVGFTVRGDTEWADEWWMRLVCLAVFGIAIWAELEKRGKVKSLGPKRHSGTQDAPQ